MEPMATMVRLMQESWRKKPESRLPMLQLQKKLDFLLDPSKSSHNQQQGTAKYARINTRSSSTIPMKSNLLIGSSS